MYSLSAYGPRAKFDHHLTGINLIDKVLFLILLRGKKNISYKIKPQNNTAIVLVSLDVLMMPYMYNMLLRILIQHKLATGNGMLLTRSSPFEDLTHETL